MIGFIKNITLLISITYCGFIFGQPPREVEKLIKKAEHFFAVENYISAHPILDKLDKSNNGTNKTTYMLGVYELRYTKKYGLAINYLEKVKINSDVNQYPRDLLLNLGDAYFLNYEFDNAQKYYLKHQSIYSNDKQVVNLIEKKINLCKNAEKQFTNPTNYQKNNIGSTINSNHREYAPVISADESFLMFTTRRYSLEHTEEAFDNEPYEDIYYSTKNVSGEWSEPWMAVTTVNSIYHEATSALTPDGQKLFFYRTTQKEKPGKIFVSKLDGKVWSEPISLNKIINTNDVITSVSITPDEQTLYFVSNKSGSKGGKDIYVTHKDANGVWQEAVNIGEQVNTEYDEESPFIHPDGKTLFFSSQGHNSMGGYDVFKTVFDGEKWSEPENMGYPLNTVEDDLHFVLSANGNNAYYTSTGKDSYGKEDIYQIIMPKTNIPLTMIRGTILCADSLKPLDVNIKLKNVETGEFVRHVYKPNPETGKYLIILPPGKIYDMVITTHGYLPYKLNVFIPNQDKFFELYQTIYLKMVHPFDKKIGQGISVDNAFFNHEGMIIDIERRKKLEELRQQKLQELINKIITTTDTNSFNNLEDAIESNFDQKYKTIGIDSSFSSLLNLVNQVIENTDSVALNHINNIVERGFYTYAEENIFFYGDPIGSIKDTIRVSTNNFTVTQPLNINDSVNFGVGEKNDILKTVSTPSVMLYYVFFDYDEYYLNDSCKSDLTEILKIYNEHPNLKFSITGYADSIGSDDFNLQLSKKRVLAIEQFLVEHLVHSNKIIKIWKGEENPLNNNETEKERAKNRRVEIKLLQE